MKDDGAHAQTEVDGRGGHTGIAMGRNKEAQMGGKRRESSSKGKSNPEVFSITLNIQIMTFSEVIT